MTGSRTIATLLFALSGALLSTTDGRELTKSDIEMVKVRLKNVAIPGAARSRPAIELDTPPQPGTCLQAEQECLSLAREVVDATDGLFLATGNTKILCTISADDMHAMYVSVLVKSDPRHLLEPLFTIHRPEVYDAALHTRTNGIFASYPKLVRDLSGERFIKRTTDGLACLSDAGSDPDMRMSRCHITCASHFFLDMPTMTSWNAYRGLHVIDLRYNVLEKLHHAVVQEAARVYGATRTVTSINGTLAMGSIPLCFTKANNVSESTGYVTKTFHLLIITEINSGRRTVIGYSANRNVNDYLADANAPILKRMSKAEIQEIRLRGFELPVYDVYSSASALLRMFPNSPLITSQVSYVKQLMNPLPKLADPADEEGADESVSFNVTVNLAFVGALCIVSVLIVGLVC